MSVIGLPRAFAHPLDEDGFPKRRFDGLPGCSISLVHTPEGDVTFLAENPRSQAVAILPTVTARQFARAILATADEADANARSAFPPVGGAA